MAKMTGSQYAASCGSLQHWPAVVNMQATHRDSSTSSEAPAERLPAILQLLLLPLSLRLIVVGLALLIGTCLLQRLCLLLRRPLVPV
jgi:hypothetical protein